MYGISTGHCQGRLHAPAALAKLDITRQVVRDSHQGDWTVHDITCCIVARYRGNDHSTIVFS